MKKPYVSTWTGFGEGRDLWEITRKNRVSHALKWDGDTKKKISANEAKWWAVYENREVLAWWTAHAYRRDHLRYYRRD